LSRLDHNPDLLPAANGFAQVAMSKPHASAIHPRRAAAISSQNPFKSAVGEFAGDATRSGNRPTREVHHDHLL
jgi:hypothetical protein